MKPADLQCGKGAPSEGRAIPNLDEAVPEVFEPFLTARLRLRFQPFGCDTSGRVGKTASIIGKAEGAVKLLHHRAIRSLRRTLTTDIDQDEPSHPLRVTQTEPALGSVESRRLDVPIDSPGH